MGKATSLKNTSRKPSSLYPVYTQPEPCMREVVNTIATPCPLGNLVAYQHVQHVTAWPNSPPAALDNQPSTTSHSTLRKTFNLYFGPVWLSKWKREYSFFHFFFCISSMGDSVCLLSEHYLYRRLFELLSDSFFGNLFDSSRLLSMEWMRKQCEGEQGWHCLAA